MTFTSTAKKILASASNPMTPQEIRELIKKNFPQYYGTPSHIRNVEKQHYKDLDHALLAQIYSQIRNNKFFYCDETQKPMRFSLINSNFDSKAHQETSLISKTKSNILEQQLNRTKNEDDLISNLDYYYNRSLSVLKEFGGPSVYFHIQSIKEQETSILSDRHIEMCYATLTSWGMHRMGDPENTKANLVEYNDFKQSILSCKKRLYEYIPYNIKNCTQAEYIECLDGIDDIYCALNISISDATIVAHSKTLAHLLPNFIPPIDRQYTIRFFTQDNKDFFTESGKYRVVNLPSGMAAQLSDFKKYCARIKGLFDRCDHSLFVIDKKSFNTSYPKIMDNIIMAYVKDVPKPNSPTTGGSVEIAVP